MTQLQWHKCETAKGVQFSTMHNNSRYVIYPNKDGLCSLWQEGKQLHVGSLVSCKTFAQQNEKQKQEK